ncbi:M14 family zinc carboxypeptidase [Georgenia sp. SUBG003]|uniref:M14 family zinc carboxypeptidase n=1 Tax=Georgenia sp. SUBG003 TaxID=1497974 RepID=UPI000694B34F
MSKRSAAVCGSAALAVALPLVALAPAAAEPHRNAGDPASGTCRTQDDPQASGWSSYEEVAAELARLEATSDGRVEVDVIGQSAEGRDIHAARVGTGDRVLIVQSAVHGNERTGTEALLGLLNDLATGNDPDTLRALEGLTLVALPIANPDGLELNRRTSVLSWEDVVEQYPQLEGAPTAWYHRASNLGIDLPGFDLNRDFNPDLDYVPSPEDLPGVGTDAGFFLAPESRAVRDLYLDLRDEFGTVDAFVDLHHMGPCNALTGGPQDGRQISVALDYPPLGVDDGAAYLAEWPLLDQDASRRHALAVAQGIQEAYGEQSPLAAVGRYLHPDEREFAGQGRSAFALNGTATVLFEVRGQSHSFGQKMGGMLTQSVQTGLESLVDSMATGAVDTLDGDDFFDMPDYGWDTTAD